MKNELANGVLTIFLEGEINSANAESVEKEILAIAGQSDLKALVLDFENLSYISSAGLRIIVMLKQQYDDLKLVKVPSVVWDVFEMVGFDNLMTIEKLDA